jgi:hypothetical protein
LTNRAPPAPAPPRPHETPGAARQISLAALGALQAALRAAPRAIEPYLDKAMPLLFLKLHAPKEAVRAAAAAALQGEAAGKQWGPCLNLFLSCKCSH